MRTIELLDENTIDQIAAGEVVERPASVVKELTENAIDANATAVTIEIKDGGISMIRITDNGAGIPKDQIRKAFMRHATSKIRKAEDLIQIASLGFRGEALSSISSVARVECITKTSDALMGSRYLISGGREEGLEEIGAPSGTTFIVRDLFYNTPARAKFLKTPQAEGSRVGAYVEELALSHPDISFKFIMNGKNRLYTSGNGNTKEIVYQIFGRDLTKELLAVDADYDNLHITGFIANPIAARGNRNFENYFVNGRYIKSPVIAKAIEDGYHGFLMQHKYPFTLLYLEMNPEMVDVNVHPAKMEVRFADQEGLYRNICLAVQNTLMRKERIPDVTADREIAHSERTELPVIKEQTPEPFESRRRDTFKAPLTDRTDKETESSSALPYNVDADKGFLHTLRESGNYNTKEQQKSDAYLYNAGRRKPDVYPSAGSRRISPELKDSPGFDFSVHKEDSAETAKSSAASAPAVSVQEESERTLSSEVSASGQEEKDRALSSAAGASEPEGKTPADGRKDGNGKTYIRGVQQDLFENEEAAKQKKTMHKLIGQLFDTYWLIEYSDSLYIIDQHAAHEKVMYERMMKNFRDKKINSQMIYPSIVIELTSEEAALLEGNMQAFTNLGYEIESFGGKSYKIMAVPANLYGIATDQLFREILDSLGSVGNTDPAIITEKLASMSCKAAVKGNNHMSVQEADALITELLGLENPYNCPHGRPTIVRMTRYELDRKFKRIV